MKNRTIKIAGFGLALAITAVVQSIAQGNSNAKRDQQEISQGKNKADKDRIKDQNEAEKDREKARDKAEKNRNKVEDKAQNDREKARDKADKNREKDRAQVDKEGDNRGRGNAYGKNKGELSGREFGQARAADARAKSGRDKKDLDNVVVDGDKKAKDAREKISRSKTELEEKRKAGKITDAEYRERQERINRAENAVINLEEKVNTGRQISITIQ